MFPAGLLCKDTLLKIETGTLVWDIMTMGNAALAGLVAITSGCSVILPWVSCCACGVTVTGLAVSACPVGPSLHLNLAADVAQGFTALL